MSKRALTEEHFIEFFGISPDELPARTRELVRKKDFSYEPLDPVSRDRTILQVLKRITSSELTVAGKEAKARWERGWQENLDDFVRSGHDPKSLLPKFIHPNTILRLAGEYVKPSDSDFELNYYVVMRDWLFEAYFGDVESVFEFGCGTAFNLVALAEKYPGKILHGLDWVSPSKEIIRLLAETRGYPMQGHVFDMFAPDPGLRLPSGAGVLMIGAMEQLGPNFGTFLEYLLEQKPRIVVQVNHLIELYDQENLLDYLAFEFERRRNYLVGYLPELQRLEGEGRVEILKLRRARLGSLFHDGYSVIVWRPKP